MNGDILITSPIKNFTVRFSNNFEYLDDLQNIPNSVIICGNVVYGFYKNRIFDKFQKSKLLVLELDESGKTLRTVEKIYKWLLPLPYKKNLTVISFGGGINQDIVGYCVSTLYRGVHWIYIPTTLLAQADSAVGLKTSLNFNKYKNVIGTFYPPDFIYIDTEFLKTLKKMDIINGMGEIAKLLLMDKNAQSRLEEISSRLKKVLSFFDKKNIEEIIKDCIRIKLSYMENDEFDHGRRNLLNYGHELGHALESASNFSVSHGIGVLLGMIYANSVSVRKGWLSKKLNIRINDDIFFPLLKLDNLKIDGKNFIQGHILSGMNKDKKKVSEKMVLVLPKGNMSLVKITDYTADELEKDLGNFLDIIRMFLI